MKALTISRLVLALTLLTSFSAFAQFNDQNSAFDAPGAGDKMREYTVRVPEGVTFTNAQGENITAGQGVAVPGSYISLMSGTEAEKALTSSMPFNMKSFNEKPFTNSMKQSMSVISLRIPEGAKLSFEDGSVAEAGQEIMLVVDAGSMQKSDIMTEEPRIFRSIGQM